MVQRAINENEFDQQLEDRLIILTREVNHRANNLLSVIQGMIRLTDAPDVATFKEILEGRIKAIHQAHSLLAEHSWEAVSFWDIVGRELAPYLEANSHRIHLSGHDARLDSHRAQTGAMIIHELTTNAVKYGALSNDTGHLTINWSIEDGKKIVRWKESGGPPILTNPTRVGSGTRMLRALSKALNATLETWWEPDGVRYLYTEYPRTETAPQL